MTALVPAKEAYSSMLKSLGSLTPHLKRVLPPDLRPEKVLAVAYASLQKTPSLMECSHQSVMAAVLSAAQLGLLVDPVLGQSYLVPFKGQCTLVVGYRGLVTLAYRSGMVRDVNAFAVREHDLFEYHLGSDVRVTHRITKKFSERGAVTHAYAVIHLTTGGQKVEVMDAEQLAAIRTRSASARSSSSPWHTDEEQMQIKTVLRRGCKQVPASGERESLLHRAAMTDEMNDAGMDPLASGDIADMVNDAINGVPPKQEMTAEDMAKRVEGACSMLKAAKSRDELRLATEAIARDPDDVRFSPAVVEAKDAANARVLGGGK